MAREQNLSLAIARESIATAKAESHELNSLWFPSLSISGEYTHSLTEIAAVTTVGEIGSELLGNLAPIASAVPAIEAILEDIGKSQLLVIVRMDTNSLTMCFCNIHVFISKSADLLRIESSETIY